MGTTAENLRLVDMAQRDVSVLVEQTGFLEENVLVGGQTEPCGEVAALHSDVSAEYGRQGGIKAGRLAHLPKAFGKRSGKATILLIQTFVALIRLLGQIPCRRRIGHH